MTEETKTGAEALVETLADNGVTHCFANPGTSEMHLVTAVDGEPRIEPVLCLFEGVATGAADGFSRISGRPAMTLLHLGAGYLNAGANLHNALRARSPIVNVIGNHATGHLRYDAPLTSDIAGMAAPNSVWLKSADTAASTGPLATECLSAATAPEGGPAALLLPADSAWSEGGVAGGAVAAIARDPATAEEVAAAAAAIREASDPVILIGGNGLSEAGLEAAGRLQAAGCRIMTDTFYPVMPRGAGRVVPDRMQYFAEGAMSDLKRHDLMLIAGTQTPVAFFAYPNKPSVLVPDTCKPVFFTERGADTAASLALLADALDAPASGRHAELALPDAPSGELTAMSVGQSLARHMPDGAFVSDDGVSNSLPSYLATASARPHDWMMLTGGAIGQGIPLALGAAKAAPDRKGVCLTGDGAGMYTVQALWSLAREACDVVVIVFVNHSYRILNIELARTGAGNPGPGAREMLHIDGPEIDWVALSQSLGVPAEAADTAEGFDAALERAFAEKGPRLVAAHLPG